MSDEDTKSWIYAGGLPYELTEGDVVCVFSQYGEIFEISLARDKDTGKSRGFCFIKYEDPRSCELAVDNLNGASIVGRRIKVSYSTNSNAIKSRKAAVVAPTEDSTLPRVEDIQKSLRSDTGIDSYGGAGSGSLLKPTYMQLGDRDRRDDDRRRHQSPPPMRRAEIGWHSGREPNLEKKTTLAPDLRGRSDDRSLHRHRTRSPSRERQRSPEMPPRSRRHRRERSRSRSTSTSSSSSSDKSRSSSEDSRKRSRHRRDLKSKKKKSKHSSKHRHSEHKSSSRRRDRSSKNRRSHKKSSKDDRSHRK